MQPEFKDYFAVLQLEPPCSLKDLRRSYRRLARSTHPDCNQDQGAAKHFLELQEAYEVLKDPSQRRAYEILWKKVQNNESTRSQRNRQSIRKKQRRVIFYHFIDRNEENQSSEKILETYEVFYESLLRTWGLNRPENLPQFILEDSELRPELNSILKELRQEHQKNRRLEAWEFTGDFLVESLMDLGRSLSECLENISQLLHDRATHEEPWLTGYAIYSIRERFEIWSDDSYDQFARLIPLLEKLYNAQALENLEDSNRRHGKLDTALWILACIRNGESSEEICKKVEGKIKISEIGGALRILGS
jgi:hypothetical protein